jgi:hypothetical protein
LSRIRADLLLALAAVIWGAAFIAQKNGGELMGPISFVGVRFLLFWLALTPLALYEGAQSRAPLKKADRSLAGLIGICVFGAAALQQMGLATTSRFRRGDCARRCRRSSMRGFAPGASPSRFRSERSNIRLRPKPR